MTNLGCDTQNVLSSGCDTAQGCDTIGGLSGIDLEWDTEPQVGTKDGESGINLGCDTHNVLGSGCDTAQGSDTVQAVNGVDLGYDTESRLDTEEGASGLNLGCDKYKMRYNFRREMNSTTIKEKIKSLKRLQVRPKKIMTKKRLRFCVQRKLNILSQELEDMDKEMKEDVRLLSIGLWKMTMEEYPVFVNLQKKLGREDNIPRKTTAGEDFWKTLLEDLKEDEVSQQLSNLKIGEDSNDDQGEDYKMDTEDDLKKMTYVRIIQSRKRNGKRSRHEKGNWIKIWIQEVVSPAREDNTMTQLMGKGGKKMTEKEDVSHNGTRNEDNNIKIKKMLAENVKLTKMTEFFPCKTTSRKTTSEDDINLVEDYRKVTPEDETKGTSPGGEDKERGVPIDEVEEDSWNRDYDNLNARKITDPEDDRKMPISENETSAVKQARARPKITMPVTPAALSRRKKMPGRDREDVKKMTPAREKQVGGELEGGKKTSAVKQTGARLKTKMPATPLRPIFLPGRDREDDRKMTSAQAWSELYRKMTTPVHSPERKLPNRKLLNGSSAQKKTDKKAKMNSPDLRKTLKIRNNNPIKKTAPNKDKLGKGKVLKIIDYFEKISVGKEDKLNFEKSQFDPPYKPYSSEQLPPNHQQMAAQVTHDDVTPGQPMPSQEHCHVTWDASQEPIGIKCKQSGLGNMKN